MSLLALQVIDETIRRLAADSNAMAVEFPQFERMSAGVGPGIRLQALTDVRDAIVRAGIREHEQGADNEAAVSRLAGQLRGEFEPWIANHPNAGYFDWKVAARNLVASEGWGA